MLPAMILWSRTCEKSTGPIIKAHMQRVSCCGASAASAKETSSPHPQAHCLGSLRVIGYGHSKAHKFSHASTQTWNLHDAHNGHAWIHEAHIGSLFDEIQPNRTSSIRDMFMMMQHATM